MDANMPACGLMANGAIDAIAIRNCKGKRSARCRRPRKILRRRRTAEKGKPAPRM
jgi:hypothetical protein